MEDILKIKKNIQNGKNIAENYELLIKLVREKKEDLMSIESKITKNTNKRIECNDIAKIEGDIDILDSKRNIDKKYINDYREILAKINFLEDYYNKNILILKKICSDNKKILLKKI